MSLRSLLRWLLPSVALMVGFADLWRGGVTLAPLALIAAYCVLIPWAIWTGRKAEDPARLPADHRPSYWMAGAIAAAVLALYVATLAPTTAMWDTSEYIAAA